MSHDFDYIVYVPFRNYAGWGVAWYSTCTASTQYSGSRGGRTRSKCHMTSITLFTCHSAIMQGGAWLGTVLVQLVHSTAGVWWEKYGTFDSQEQ